MVPTENKDDKEDDTKKEGHESEAVTTLTPAPAPTPAVRTIPPKTYQHSSHRISFRQELDNSEEEHPLHRSNNKGRVSFQDEYHAEISSAGDADGDGNGNGESKDSNHVDGNNNNNNNNKRSDERRQRTKIGKADPIRDGGIVLAIFLGFFLIARAFTNLMSRPPDDGIMVEPLNKPSQMKQMKQVLMELVQAQARPYFDNPLRTHPQICPVMLSPSRIPQAGWGFYAGQNYTTGQEIMILSPPSWAIHHALNEDPLWVTPEAFLFKHHPTLTNVKTSESLWTTTTTATTTMTSDSTLGVSGITLHATKPIQQGQELFLDYHQHLHSILPTWYDPVIPTLEDYNEATEILHQARNFIRDPPGARGRNLSKQQSVVGSALRMIQQVVARYRPAAAKLMGTTMEAIAQFRGKAIDVNCLELGLKNITWKYISIHGMCVNDIMAVPATEESIMTTTTVHAVPKGHRFYPIPVLLQHRSVVPDKFCWVEETSSAGSCRSAETTIVPTQCWSWERDQHAPFQVCPLQQSFHSNRIQRAAMSTVSDGDKERTNPTTTTTTTSTIASTPKKANVKLEWSSWKTATAVMNSNGEPPTELKHQLELLMMVDLIAIQDLQAGDELILAMDMDSNTDEWVLSPELLPTHWRKMTYAPKEGPPQHS